jgi:hypothetical protein
VPISYKGTPLKASYRIDLLVEDLVIVEVKSVNVMLPVFEAQVLTYLRITSVPVALLINFNVPRLMQGVQRLLNNHLLRERANATQPTDLTQRHGETETHGDHGSTGRPA